MPGRPGPQPEPRAHAAGRPGAGARAGGAPAGQCVLCARSGVRAARVRGAGACVRATLHSTQGLATGLHKVPAPARLLACLLARPRTRCCARTLRTSCTRRWTSSRRTRAPRPRSARSKGSSLPRRRRRRRRPWSAHSRRRRRRRRSWRSCARAWRARALQRPRRLRCAGSRAGGRGRCGAQHLGVHEERQLLHVARAAQPGAGWCWCPALVCLLRRAALRRPWRRHPLLPRSRLRVMRRAWRS